MGGVSVTESGKGPTVVLLHSLLADAGSWAPLAARLAGRARLVVPNLPGFGDSPAVAGGLAEIAAAVAEALRPRLPAAVPGEVSAPVPGGVPAEPPKDVPAAVPPAGRGAVPAGAAAGATSGVAVVGNGFGSFVALRLALDSPELVSRLLLVGTGARFSDTGRAAFAGMRSRAAAGGLAAIADTAMARLFQADFAARHPEMLAERRAAFLRTDPAMFGRACAALEALDLAGEAPRIACPVRILVGEADQATPPEMGLGLARLLPRADATVLDGLAHVPQMQDPARIADAVAAFLDLPAAG
jgi:3-oxoadipate enol-lactonase